MPIYHIKCAHETSGAPTSQVLSDHYDLSVSQIRDLLVTAQNDPSSKSSIQTRLAQGIVGLQCPRQNKGSVAEAYNKLNQLVIDRDFAPVIAMDLYELMLSTVEVA